MLRVGFAGDVMLGRGVDRRQRRRDVGAIWGDLLPALRDLDGFVINLECCCSTRGERWPGRPFHFRADPEWAVPALQEAGADCCALANNHLLDFGDEALRDTLAALDDGGIAHAGAGESLAAAIEPTTFTVGDLSIAVVSFTGNTPAYAADEDTAGVARVEFDLEDEESRSLVADAVARAREHDPDLLIASLHSGPNMVTKPDPTAEEFGRWLIERGVDVVHGHSAHVFHGIEVHEGRPICYDCGDFVDDYVVDERLRNDRSFLFTLVVDDEPVELVLRPVEIREYAVSAAPADEVEWWHQRMRERSAPYGTDIERDGERLIVPV